MKLVPIEESGVPAESVDHLPDAGVQALAMTAAMYGRHRFERPWIGYLAIADSGACVGTCAFTAPPRDGRVEIAYFTFPGHEGHGHATQMARALLGLAGAAAPELTITAQTRPQLGASAHILGKLGFTLTAGVDHPEEGRVWEWWLPPASQVPSAAREVTQFL